MDNPSLEQCMKVALSLETSESQANLMCGTVNQVHHESRKWVKNGNSTNSSSRERKCFACGRYGHIKLTKNVRQKERSVENARRRDILRSVVNPNRRNSQSLSPKRTK